MKFCEVCGSFMVRTARGLRCPKCGEVVTLDVIEVRRAEKPVVEPVYVIENVGDEALKVAQRCPQCGNNEAYRSVHTTQGEHAGVKQDRSIERYTCSRCHYSWTKN